MKRILRWILVVPAAIAAWYLVFISGIIVHGWVEHWLCPPHEVLSGMCMNVRVIRTLRAVVVLFVALSAVAVVLAAVITAPEQKVKVAWLTFAVGGMQALILAGSAKSPLAGAAAIIAGLVTALIITRNARH